MTRAFNELHLQIDLETLGTHDNCLVIQAAFVVFDPTSKYISTALSKNFLLDVHEQRNQRDISLDTLIWWLKTNPKLLASLMTTEHRTPIRDFLTCLNETIWNHNIQGIWANSPSFDLKIIASLYKQAGHGIQNAISFRKERDVRTIKALANIGIPEVEAEMRARGYEVGDVHNAYYDCIFQSVQVQMCYEKLGLSIPLDKPLSETK